MTLIEKLKTLTTKGYKKELTFNAFKLSKAKNWPTIPEYLDYDENNNPIDEGYREPLDMENWKITEVANNYLILKCGGDWQEPHELTIVLNEDDELEVISYKKSDFNGREINMDKLLGF